MNPEGAGRLAVLPVNEVFGPVPQGEGPYMGRRSVFVRLGRGCNLSCPPCDTKETWDRSQYDIYAAAPLTPVSRLLRRVEGLAGAEEALTVVTGGEPLLWQQTAGWDAFLDGSAGPLHLETNGTIAPTDAVRRRFEHVTVSPKLRAMGGADPEKRRIRPDALAAFAELAAQERAAFKFVCASRGDVDEVLAFVEAYRVPHRAVWIMPLGSTAPEAADCGRGLIAAVMASGLNWSGRLHLELGVR
ncbi:7-carboxy-7-deazaguanine synthase QueE [Streptomyces sp. NPDC088739]|uniref:7-carboxy-7-deazaguanine synthase QueE n=1 Tax=Streptomyces sp. NPDC088739 TaxID=3365882 RepID=UPI003819E520